MKLTVRDKKLLNIAWWGYMFVVLAFAVVLLYNVRTLPALLIFVAIALLIPASVPGMRRSLRSGLRGE
jgi:hypothetical protein